jgi:hypothetical protein
MSREGRHQTPASPVGAMIYPVLGNLVGSLADVW